MLHQMRVSRHRRLLIALALAALLPGGLWWLFHTSRPKEPTTESKPTSAVSQTRAGLEGSTIQGYQAAVPGRAYRFPADHAAHPRYATEWWYYTGHLRDVTGREYGYQWTFFRVGVGGPSARRSSAWAVSDIYFAHFAVTDAWGQRHLSFERASRGSVGEAGADAGAYRVWLQDWRGSLDGDTHVVSAMEDGTGISLRATPLKPPVIHGRNGISQKAKGEGRASHYYSYTRMRTEGTLTLDGRLHRVSGESWFDHEFGSNQMAPGQVGWDWFSLQMADGTEAMLYRMRNEGNTTDPYSSGTLVRPDGTSIHLDADDFEILPSAQWESPESGGVYPSRWNIRIPEFGWDVTVTPVLADQEMRANGTMGVTYWEGSVRVSGTKDGQPASGKGYVELTGYAEPMRQTF